ncbi:MAG: cytochrome b/b6 domain-containing protein [Betaproteobacteria bacterium]|nr:cytochrome b/b6 domain-containing protein [Betaproteobacteria bacterium]
MNYVQLRQADESVEPVTVAEPGSATRGRMLVWDLPVRLFHWSLALAFSIAFLSSESERWQLVHIASGYVVAALIAFRLVWGLVGSRYARFAEFVRGPAAIREYVSGMLRLRPPHYTGHNPAGALAVLALLGLGLFTAVTGWMTFNEVGGDWLEEVHEGAAGAMLALVGIHVGAVVLSSLVHRENLVAAMWHGYKAGAPEAGIRRAHAGVALGVLALIAGAIYLAVV